MKNLDATALARRIEERAAADLAEGRLSGVAISVSQAGRELYRGFLGRQSPEGNAPLCEDALFRLASMTKPITAAAILLLEDRGLLSIDDPVCRYLPAFSDLRVAVEGAAASRLLPRPPCASCFPTPRATAGPPKAAS